MNFYIHANMSAYTVGNANTTRPSTDMHAYTYILISEFRLTQFYTYLSALDYMKGYTDFVHNSNNNSNKIIIILANECGLSGL